MIGIKLDGLFYGQYFRVNDFVSQLVKFRDCGVWPLAPWGNTNFTTFANDLELLGQVCTFEHRPFVFPQFGRDLFSEEIYITFHGMEGENHCHQIVVDRTRWNGFGMLDLSNHYSPRRSMQKILALRVFNKRRPFMCQASKSSDG